MMLAGQPDGSKQAVERHTKRFIVIDDMDHDIYLHERCLATPTQRSNACRYPGTGPIAEVTVGRTPRDQR